jgi:lipopolysaccharide transport system ATP-binding protein
MTPGHASPPAVQVRQVSKVYGRSRHRLSLRHELNTILGRSHSQLDTFAALSDISFTIFSGESVAIIGRNGAGKTTLLRLLCGITQPSAGTITVHQRFGSLIGVGAGFIDELTGRQNIYLNAAIQGAHRSQINAEINSMIAFSELEDAIDLPIKLYSSGMYARLGFSIAIHLVPQILFLDEVLAVGDAAFQEKCYNRLVALKADNRTLVLVSHDHAAVRRLCERCIWLDAGRLRMDGPTETVLTAYEQAELPG